MLVDLTRNEITELLEVIDDAVLYDPALAKNQYKRLNRAADKLLGALEARR